MPNVKNKLDVYSLDHLKPEVVAVAFAKCSRSAESFRDIAAALTDEKSADFHEKWVVGYGHSSVAEHATMHLAVENVSILATKVIEDNRLASYTEKSTRYQVFDKTKYYRPSEILKSKFVAAYAKTMDYIFDTYESFNAPMKKFIEAKYPLGTNQPEKIYRVITKARVCDNTRYLLPTATLTNLGMTANARVWEHAIVKLLSHPLEEMRQIGKKIKTEALKITPTLIKFANENNYLKIKDNFLSTLTDKILKPWPEPAKAVNLVDYDKDAENKLVASLMYRHSILSYAQIYATVKKLSRKQKEKIIDGALKDRGEFDAPPRELENIYYTFDVLMDYGAFRDIQRHRMCTQLNQPVTVIHGYETPEEIIEAGLGKKFSAVMDRAADLYNKLYAQFPHAAQYVVPLAFRKRTLITWNLRELHHFIALRSGAKGHISYRRVAQACWTELNKIHPLLAKYIRVNMKGGSDSWASTMFKPEYNYLPKKLFK